MFVVVRLKGEINLTREVEHTLRMLRLYKKHTCIVVPAKPEIVGMLNKVQRYITWGEPSKELITELLKKRGRLPGNKKVTEDYLKEKVKKNFEQVAEELVDSKIKIVDIPGLKPFFRLKPPTKGIEAGGLRTPFSLGGSHGYRGKKIDDLVKRMI